MRAPSVIRCRSSPAPYMTSSTIARTSGTDSATTMPVRQPSDRKLTTSTMSERLGKGLDEFRYRLIDDVRLIGDLGDLDSDRQLGGDGLHRLLEVLAERDDVRAVGMETPSPMRRLAAFAHDEGRRVLVTALDRGDVAEPNTMAVRLHRHGGDGFDSGEGAGHPQIDPVGRGLDRSAGDHGVLLGDAVEDLLGRYAERGELGVAELDENLLRPLADDVDLVDVGNAQQASGGCPRRAS